VDVVRDQEDVGEDRYDSTTDGHPESWTVDITVVEAMLNTEDRHRERVNQVWEQEQS
jgi:hypothetical protein